MWALSINSWTAEVVVFLTYILISLTATFMLLSFHYVKINIGIDIIFHIASCCNIASYLKMAVLSPSPEEKILPGSHGKQGTATQLQSFLDETDYLHPFQSNMMWVWVETALGKAFPGC